MVDLAFQVEKSMVPRSVEVSCFDFLESEAGDLTHYLHSAPKLLLEGRLCSVAAVQKAVLWHCRQEVEESRLDYKLQFL